MWQAIRALDGLLRGEATRPDAIRDRTLDFPVVGLSAVIVVLAAVYGACMGTFSLFKVPLDATTIDSSDRLLQLVASTVKVPALFFLTLLVTFPSLYVFNALVGSRLRLPAVMRLLIASLGVNLAVLASLGPIVAFFSVSTQSYHFIVLFNVLIFSVAGVLGLVFLVQTLNRMSIGDRPPTEVVAAVIPAQEQGETGGDEASSENDDQADQSPPAADDLAGETGALDAIEGHLMGRHVKLVFRCWVVVFGLVGAQMGWVLRPFIGSPNQPFEWFRERDSNFFYAVLQIFIALLTGKG